MGHMPRDPFVLRATIDQMDNGAVMIIRKRNSANPGGVVQLNKVYTDFEALVKDLKEHMKFNFPRKREGNGK